MYLRYRDSGNCIGSKKGSYPQLKKFIAKLQAANNVKDWAIYHEYLIHGRFHNTTDRRYLVEHDDSYWHNWELINMPVHHVLHAKDGDKWKVIEDRYFDNKQAYLDWLKTRD